MTSERMGVWKKILLLQVLLATTVSCNWRRRQRKLPPPHIVLVVADDLGWNDVSWHNKDMITPRMEEISAGGLRLEKSYVTPKCSPSRAAMMTGYYPWRLGRQRGAIERYHPSGLNTSIRILPEYLKDAGYSTHLVGKWHLGYCHEAYLPNNRGFDSFFGQYNHVTDYYTRRVDAPTYTKEEMRGYDFRDNFEVTHEGDGEFSTDLFTRKAVNLIKNHNKSEPLFLYLAYQAPHGPVQMPPDEYRKYPRNSILRRTRSEEFLSTVTALDAGVGRVYDALKDSGLYENTVFIFTTDNGGATTNSNLPLRGVKEQLYEGGIRGVGFVNSPLLRHTGEHNGMMFISDWFSTLIGLAGKEHEVPADVDSVSQWKSLTRDTKSPRKEIILNLDQNNKFGQWSAAMIKGPYKLIWGQDYLLKQRLPDKSCDVELYNLRKDPNETTNLARGRNNLIGEMKDKLMENFKQMRRADYPMGYHPAGFPGRHGGILTSGWCQARL